MLAPVDYRIYFRFFRGAAAELTQQQSRVLGFRFADGICVQAICADAKPAVDNDSLIR